MKAFIGSIGSLLFWGLIVFWIFGDNIKEYIIDVTSGIEININNGSSNIKNNTDTDIDTVQESEPTEIEETPSPRRTLAPR